MYRGNLSPEERALRPVLVQTCLNPCSSLQVQVDLRSGDPGRATRFAIGVGMGTLLASPLGYC